MSHCRTTCRVNWIVCLYLPIFALSQNYSQTFNEGFDLFFYTTNNGWPWKRGGDSQFVRSEYARVVDNMSPRTTLLWTHTPISNSSDRTDNFIRIANIMGQWFFSGDAIIALLPDLYLQGHGSYSDNQNESQPLDCAAQECSLNDVCEPYYYCLMEMKTDPGTDNFTFFGECLFDHFGFNSQAVDSSKWSCLISLSSDSGDKFNVYGQFGSCHQLNWHLTQENWATQLVDEQLQIAMEGGVDHDGIYWQGRSEGETLAQAVGRQFWDEPAVECSLKAPCHRQVDCRKIGSWTSLAIGYPGKVTKRPFAFLASSAFSNLNLQLVNQHNQLQHALERLALDTFSIDTFFPHENRNFDVQNSLIGLGVVFTIFGGFIPGGASALALNSAGTIASGVGSFLANSRQRDPNEAQERFSDQVNLFYDSLVEGMENITTRLFAGEQITNPGPGNDTIDIFDIIRNGAWVNTNALTDISELNEKIRTEILARSIDSLWKTPTSNKMWVLFTNVEGINKTQACLDGKSHFQAHDSWDNASLQNGPSSLLSISIAYTMYLFPLDNSVSSNYTSTTTDHDMTGLTSHVRTDKSGPQSSKYCADDGVYYTYNFIEHGAGGGNVGMPWGADQLARANNNFTVRNLRVVSLLAGDLS